MPATIVKLTRTGDDRPLLEACAKTLDAGGLAIVPMETVYGLLARLDHSEAFRRLSSLRENDAARAATVHVASAAQAEAYIDPPNDYARHLMRKLWPGPVAFVFKVSPARQQEISRNLQVEPANLFDHNHVTLRCPAHTATRQILALCQHPIVGVGVPPIPVDRMPAHILEKADMVLDDGEPLYGKPSTVVQVSEQSFDILRAGVYDRRIIEKMLKITILFVCSGNTCRSPMAEAITRKVLADYLKVPESELASKGYTVLSAGAMAMSGAQATDHAVEAVKDLGADLSRHRSRSLTEAMINQADVIFAMGSSHVQAVKMMVPSAANKVVTLDPNGDIDDPIGGELELYQSLAAQIKAVVEQRLADRSLFGPENAK